MPRSCRRCAEPRELQRERGWRGYVRAVGGRGASESEQGAGVSRDRFEIVRGVRGRGGGEQSAALCVCERGAPGAGDEGVYRSSHPMRGDHSKKWIECDDFAAVVCARAGTLLAVLTRAGVLASEADSESARRRNAIGIGDAEADGGGAGGGAGDASDRNSRDRGAGDQSRGVMVDAARQLRAFRQSLDSGKNRALKTQGC